MSGVRSRSVPRCVLFSAILGSLVAGCGGGDDGAASAENLGKIGTAFSAYALGQRPAIFPGPIRSREGKPLLSWRVTILPLLGQDALFKEFKLDEPWDSANNLPLLARMPDVYVNPSVSAAPGKTFYRCFSGPHTLFDPARPRIDVLDVVDGLSGTLAVVEAKEAVEWTKPDNEIPIEGGDAMPRVSPEQLASHASGDFYATTLNPRVVAIKGTIAPNLLAALVTIDKGEQVADNYYPELRLKKP